MTEVDTTKFDLQAELDTQANSLALAPAPATIAIALFLTLVGVASVAASFYYIAESVLHFFSEGSFDIEALGDLIAKFVFFAALPLWAGILQFKMAFKYYQNMDLRVLFQEARAKNVFEDASSVEGIRVRFVNWIDDKVSGIGLTTFGSLLAIVFASKGYYICEYYTAVSMAGYCLGAGLVLELVYWAIFIFNLNTFWEKGRFPTVREWVKHVAQLAIVLGFGVVVVLAGLKGLNLYEERKTLSIQESGAWITPSSTVEDINSKLLEKAKERMKSEGLDTSVFLKTNSVEVTHVKLQGKKYSKFKIDVLQPPKAEYGRITLYEWEIYVPASQEQQVANAFRQFQMPKPSWLLKP